MDAGRESSGLPASSDGAGPNPAAEAQASQEASEDAPRERLRHHRQDGLLIAGLRMYQCGALGALHPFRDTRHA